MKKVFVLALVAFVTMLTLSACEAGGEEGVKDNGGGAAAAGPLKAGEITFKFTPTDGAETVNIAGSFQGWNPSDPNYAMEKAGDTFTLVAELEAGKYMWKFVIDGNWVQSMEDFAGQFSPDGGEFVDDGFGGKNSVLEIE